MAGRGRRPPGVGKDLVAAITTFIDGWNDRCRPFVWTKTFDEVLPHGRRQATSDARH